MRAVSRLGLHVLRRLVPKFSCTPKMEGVLRRFATNVCLRTAVDGDDVFCSLTGLKHLSVCIFIFSSVCLCSCLILHKLVKLENGRGLLKKAIYIVRKLAQS